MHNKAIFLVYLVVFLLSFTVLSAGVSPFLHHLEMVFKKTHLKKQLPLLLLTMLLLFLADELKITKEKNEKLQQALDQTMHELNNL